MGDTHFILRHGLTGFVFLIFLLFGFFANGDVAAALAASPEIATNSLERLLAFLKGASFRSAAPALVGAFLTTPVFGVLIQGIHVALIYIRQTAWADPARQEVAERIRAEVRDRIDRLQDRTMKRYPHLLDSVRSDSLFVWLYYSQASDQMIDWARRRRSYHYLGANWVIGAIVGFVGGYLVPEVLVLSRDGILGVLGALSIAWGVGTFWVAREMKHDVDDMEFVWALSQLHPKAFKAFLSDRGSSSGGEGPAASS